MITQADLMATIVCLRNSIWRLLNRKNSKLINKRIFWTKKLIKTKNLFLKFNNLKMNKRIWLNLKKTMMKWANFKTRQSTYK